MERSVNFKIHRLSFSNIIISIECVRKMSDSQKKIFKNIYSF